MDTKNGVSSVELARRLGVNQPTAWTMKHKIMAVMVRRKGEEPLSGRVEMEPIWAASASASVGAARRARYPSWRRSRPPPRGVRAE